MFERGDFEIGEMKAWCDIGAVENQFEVGDRGGSIIHKEEKERILRFASKKLMPCGKKDQWRSVPYPSWRKTESSSSALKGHLVNSF